MASAPLPSMPPLESTPHHLDYSDRSPVANQLLDTALQLHALGHAVLPVKPDGSKAPAVPWKTFIDHPADTDQLQSWFANGTYDGLGVITGRDGFVMLEAEGRAVTEGLHGQLATLMASSGLGELWARICTGWMELTPSGGLHWYVRVVDHNGEPAKIAGNTKLARRPGAGATPVEVLFETRGAGGFTVTAPSGGRSHPEGKTWTALSGFGTPAVLTVEEYDAVVLAMTTFDQMPTPTAAAPHAPSTSSAGGDRPGDDFNSRATWDDILTPRGWTKGRTVGGATAWTRPGKDPRDGISATTGKTLRTDGVDRLYVFTTSTEFEAEKPYDKLGAIALLEHGGDIAKAASALRSQGYGKPLDRAPDASTDQPSGNLRDLIAHADKLVSDAAASIAPAALPRGGLRTSEDTHARLLVSRYGDVIRYCHERRRWLTWNGSRWTWEPESGGRVAEFAKEIARELPSEARDEIAQKRRALSANGIAGCLKLARTDARICVDINELDADPYTLNTPGGLVDLRTGRISPATSSTLCTRTTTVTPAATYRPELAPRWERFLAETFAGQPELAVYLQRLLGHALIGKVMEQYLSFAHGKGSTGKSTSMNVVTRLVGTESQNGYSAAASSDILLDRRNIAHPTEIARLAGIRIVITSELEDGERFAEAKLKRLTGGDVLAGRFMGKDFFTFRPTHYIFLLANHQPEVRTGDDAIWRRIRLLPFVHQVPEEHRNRRLEDELVEHEGPHILAWMIAGAVDYLSDGLAEPETVRIATKAYEVEQDTVGRFVLECCETGPAGAQTFSIASSELRLAYERWCSEAGETPVSAKAFSSALKTRFDVVLTRTMHTRMLDGIRLQNDMTDASSGSEEEKWWDR